MARGRGRLAWFVANAVGWTASALYLTLASRPPGPLRQDLDDLVAHFGLGILVAGGLLCVVQALFPERHRMLRASIGAAAASVAFLVSTELLQALSFVREPQFSDAGADTLGVAIITVAMVGAFIARPPVPYRTANAFAAFATISLMAVVIGAFSAPPSPGRSAGAPVRSADDVNSCMSGFRLLERQGQANVASTPVPPDDSDSIEPLARFDLAVDPLRSSGALAAIALEAHGRPVIWPGRGVIFGGRTDALRSEHAAEDLLAELKARREFTVDAWIALDDLEQGGPARIVTLSGGTKRSQVNMHVGVENAKLSIRIRSACDDTNWVLAGQLSTDPTHVAVTFDRGRVSGYIDGVPIVEYRLSDTDLRSWLPSTPLIIGNESSLDRGLLGVVSLVEIRGSALTAAEIIRLADSLDRRDELTTSRSTE